MPNLVVQEDGAAQPFQRWRTEAEASEEAELREEQAWTAICGRLVQRAVDRAETAPFNVFVLFDRAELLEDRDRPALARLIQRAREHCWGARILLVLVNAPLISLIPRSERADIGAWMDEVLKGRVADVVQIATPYDSKALRDHASDVAKRHEILRDATGERPWRAALPPNWVQLAAILGPLLAVTKATDDLTFDLVIVLQDLPVEEQEAEIERHLAKDPERRRRYRVVTYMHDPDHLLRFCEEHELPEPAAIGGDFELWYLLLRLREQARAQQSIAESICPVTLAKTPRLRVAAPDRFPAVLLTTVFDPAEEEQWLEAATDVGRFLHLSPLGMEYRVELATGPERLVEILGEMPVIHAWIHMGHGSGKAGLWVPDQGDVSPEKWVQCFHDRELLLALFLTCDSHDIARHFAEQGANVAIGFEGEVESTKARQLAIGVLEAMLTDGMRGGSILAGFRYGEARFDSAQTLNARPRAYYPRRV